MNKFLEGLGRLLGKIASGRYMAFMMITATLCYAVILSLNAVLGLTKANPEVKDVIEKVAMFILGAFTTIATGLYKEYFDRADRQPKQIEGEQK